MFQDVDKKIKNKKGVNPIVAGVAGAVIGAGAAVAASQALKDNKPNKQKAKKTLYNIKDQTMDYIQNLRTEEKAQEKPSKKKIVKKVKEKTKKV